MDFGNVGNAVFGFSLFAGAGLLLLMAVFRHVVNEEKKKRGLKK